MKRCIVDTSQVYGYEELLADIAELEQRYSFLEAGHAGRSVLGKSIPVLRIGTGDCPIHVNASFHANEWITSLLAMKFVEDLAQACANKESLYGMDVDQLLGQTTLWVVPMVNPDGVELVHGRMAPESPIYAQLLDWNHGSADFSGWKANARGVDLNDQFPAGWGEEKERRGVTAPGPRDYGGDQPLSEPEACAIAELTRSRDFRMVLALHTQGEEIYWNYRDLEPPESEEMACRLSLVSGYIPIKLTDSDAGYKDWFIQEFRRPGFTIEAGLGVNPLPLSQFPAMYVAVARMILEAMAMGSRV
ncbi:M14 family metallocarboxypeptidase [Paenibacillus sp. 32352]|uniref:M14 family metallopeptidase n=1 Tax=Paenibacillus sp. 32352 TaxID=1969111 RepID=UPI0009AD7F9C|nr:M14 family metallocarboxypeptidase [Paenibacillus sp. 32352]